MSVVLYPVGNHSVRLPDYGIQLLKYTQNIPTDALPVFLAKLESAGAYRYQYWAADLHESEESSNGLLECAHREAAIHQQIESLYTLPAEQKARIDKTIPKVIGACHKALNTLPILEQIRVQADAERQNADLWRTLARRETDSDLIAGLNICADLDDASAECLEDLLERSVQNMITSRHG